MTAYIFATRKSDSRSSEAEIVGYKYYYTNDTSKYYYHDKYQMRELHREGDKYFSFRNISKVEAKWKQSNRGEWYLQTDPNANVGDNLLNLPDC